MKPKTDVVMADVIRQIKEAFPFELGEDEICGDSCSHGCAKNLLEYMHAEITEWELRLQKGEIPNFGDINKLSRTGKKIYKVLQKNNLVASGDGQTEKSE